MGSDLFPGLLSGSDRISYNRLGKASIKKDKLGLLAEVRGGGVRMGFKGPTLLYGLYYMAKKGLKLIKFVLRPYNRAQVRRGGEGLAEVQPKDPVCQVVFFKPSLLCTSKVFKD